MAIGEFGMGPGCAFWLMRGARVSWGKSIASRHSDCTWSTFRAGVLVQGACPMLSQKLLPMPGQMGN